MQSVKGLQNIVEVNIVWRIDKIVFYYINRIIRLFCNLQGFYWTNFDFLVLFLTSTDFKRNENSI